MSARDRRSGEASQLGLDLPEAGRSWPPHERFPYNFGGRTVDQWVRDDLRASRESLLVTAYSSLDVVVDFLAECGQLEEERPGRLRRVRVLFGVEPAESGLGSLGTRARGLPAEVAAYWLERGISLIQCGRLLDALRFLETGPVRIRLSGRPLVHAKIFRGDDAVVLGSSNFSRGGLLRNVEGNVRFVRGEGEEGARYREAELLAERIWALGQEFTDGLRELLEGLLRKVGWREALARACAELLEGAWAERYTEVPSFGRDTDLWPSQREGIAQAMWVIENAGSVLVADATGSGKTRMGAHLIRALQLRNWRTGRLRSDLSTLVCPPHVEPRWRREAVACGQSLQVYSHGVLSQPSARRSEEAEAAVRRAQILAVDEAHNFLNRTSARSRVVLGNMADHVLLFTATPVNRGLADLVAIVELLGADNFEPRVLDAVARLSSRRRAGEPFEEETMDRVREALQRFVVRRTKPVLNRLVDREPDRYRNALGDRCRYPEHRARVYPAGGTEEDREAAREIRRRARTLRGLFMLRSPLRLPGLHRSRGWTDETYLRWRLAGARGLAIHNVMSPLRSSRAALYEHLKGTAAAQARFEIPGPGKTGATGDVIGTVEGIAGDPPASELDAELPSWLTDPVEHRRACAEEVETYREIAGLVEGISPDREEGKAERLLQILGHHPLLLAYDRHLISLFDLRARLERRGLERVVLATGSRRSEQRRLAEIFALGAEPEPTVGLCSDALSETVNLQGASALVHLDMPTVIRLVEQRIGRVDRMDSPHRSIEVYWPKDAPEFAVRADEKLFSRHQDVAELLGSNVPLPEGLVEEAEGPADDTDRVVSPEELIREFEEEERREVPRDRLRDAFDPVRRLVRGSDALLSEELYEAVRGAGTRVLSSVAVVGAGEGEWAFLAVAGTRWRAPRWVYLPRPDGTPETDLAAVSRALRRRLRDETEDRSFDPRAEEVLRRAIERVGQTEERLLPGRKRRALEEMRPILDAYLEEARASGDDRREQIVGALAAIADPGRGRYSVDRARLADWWLDRIRPAWHEHLAGRRRRRPAVLREIRGRLKDDPIATEELETIWEVDLEIPPLDRRVVAAVVGVGVGRAGPG